MQDNGTDCGLFLLHYIEKFLEAAPQNLIYHNLDDMFNDNWFPPIEASNLRGKIQRTMMEQFEAKSECNDSLNPQFGSKKEFDNNFVNGTLS